MAGEDPGASTIAVILDAIQRAWGAVTGSLKAVMSGVVDVVKTSMFFRWRKQMMQANSGVKLKHGYQSLKHLRHHEDRGATLKSVEIGTKDDAKLFKKELKRAHIDFSLTHDRDGNYTLHYKSANDQDVLHAQYNILQQRYGNQSHDDQNQNATPDDSRENDRDRDSAPSDKRDQDDQEREQREREEQERSDGQQAIPLPNIHREEESRTEGDLSTPSEDEQERLDREETTPARTETTERTTSHAQQAPGVSDTVRAEANQPKTGFSRTAISHEPLSELKKQAQARARAKNLARSQGKNLSHARHAHRVKTRDFEPSH